MLFNMLHILDVFTLYADLPMIISPFHLHLVIVIVGYVPGIGMHTFTVSEVASRGKIFILATESMPHGCVDIFSNIEDAALFLFSKFARYSPQENDKIQISFALVYSPNIFPNTTMLTVTASLTDGKSSLTVKLKGMNGSRRQRGCKKNRPLNYSDNPPTFQIDKSNFPSSHQKRKDIRRKERIHSARANNQFHEKTMQQD